MSSRPAKQRLRIAVLLRRLRSAPDRVNDEQVLGQCERAALTAALKLAEELDAEVTAISVGTAKREERVLATTLRAGCDHAVRIYDRNVDRLDYYGLARVLAGALRKLDIDLVLCGDRSEDELRGALGPAVAELLSVPHLSGVVDVRGDGDALIARHRGAGQFHNYRCRWPAVLCVHSFPRSRHPRHERPRRSPGGIEQLDLAAVDLDARELAHRQRLVGEAHPRRGGVNATMAGDVDDLIARLRADHLI